MEGGREGEGSLIGLEIWVSIGNLEIVGIFVMSGLC